MREFAVTTARRISIKASVDQYTDCWTSLPDCRRFSPEDSRHRSRQRIAPPAGRINAPRIVGRYLQVFPRQHHVQLEPAACVPIAREAAHHQIVRSPPLDRDLIHSTEFEFPGCIDSVVPDTVGYNHVSSFAPHGGRNCSRSYSRQYETDCCQSVPDCPVDSDTRPTRSHPPIPSRRAVTGPLGV
jgi:hypothetical protein